MPRNACYAPRPGAILLGTTQAGLGLECLPMVVRPLGRETKYQPPPTERGAAPLRQGEHGNEGDHHPGSDLHPEVIAG
jgi:hypothetical protein